MKIDWKKEAKDQGAHALVCLVVCLLVHPASAEAILFLTLGLWAVREHAQHGWRFTDGSGRDLVGWFAGAMIYAWRAG